MLDYTPSPGDRLLCIGDTDGTSLEVGQVYTVNRYYPRVMGFPCVSISAGVVIYSLSRFTRYLPHIYRR